MNIVGQTTGKKRVGAFDVDQKQCNKCTELPQELEPAQTQGQQGLSTKVPDLLSYVGLAHGHACNNMCFSVSN